MALVALCALSPQPTRAEMERLSLTEEEAAFVQSKKVIRVANETDWPPFDYTMLGKPKGFSIDYINLVAQKAGFKIKFINGYTWTELIELFKEQKIDVIPAIYRNKERESFIKYGKPYYTGTTGLLSLKHRDQVIESLSDLAHMRIGIQESDGSIPLLKKRVPHLILVESKNTEDLVHLLIDQQVDYVIGNSLLLAYLSERTYTHLFNLSVLAEANFEGYQKLSFHIGVQKNEELLHQILVKAQEAISSEEMSSIEHKWLFSQPLSNPRSNALADLTKAERDFVLKSPPIVLGGGESFVPYVIRRKDGSVVGHDIDIIKMIAQRTGLKIEIEIGNWSQIQEKAKNKEIDGLFTASLTQEREAYLSASDPYLQLTPFVFVKKGNPKGIYRLDDLSSDKTSGFQKGNALKNLLGDEVNRRTNTLYFDSNHNVLQALASGQVDFTTFETSIFYIAREVGLEHMIEIAFPIDAQVTLHFQIRKDRPELVEIFNKGIKSISYKEKSDIRNRWFYDYDKVDRDQISMNAEERAYLSEKGVFKVCIDPKWMPYEQINDEGIYEGISSDYLKIFSERLGVRFEIYPTQSWGASIEAAKNKKCDLLPLLEVSQERKSFLKFTDPYLSLPYVIATHSDEMFIEDIAQKMDKKFGVTRGYTAFDRLKAKYPRIDLIEVENNLDGLERVARGDLFGFIGSNASLSHVLYQKNIRNIKIAGKLPLSFQLRAGVHLDEPILHALLQRAINSIPKAEKKRIHDKWVAIGIKKIIDYSIVWKIVLIIAAIMMIIGESYRRIAVNNKKLLKLNQELKVALEENQTLKGIIPICSYCKQIRDDEGAWDKLEAYLTEHTQAEFSHGICPDCFKEQMAELDDEEEANLDGA